jgi:pilus assembly protein CpaE
MTNILILAATAEMNQLVAAMPDHHVTTVNRKDVEHLARPATIGKLLETGEGSQPQIVILGDDVPVGEALSIAQILDSGFPLIELMLISEADADIALRAMRVGIREIVPPTISSDELKVLLHRASSNVSSRMNPHLVAGGAGMVDSSRVIVVASPKGGVGKSTIAANLAVSLGAAQPMETVLVDLDIQFGDCATLLDLQPTHSIADAFSTAAALDTLVLKTFLTVHPAGFYVLCGAESPTVVDRVSADHVKRLLGQLSSQFRTVIVDTSAGLNEHTLAALEEANDVILVSTMDVSSIRAMRKEMDVLAELALLPSSRHIVVNMSDRHSGLVVRDVEQVLGVPVNVVIPRSPDVPVAGNRGESLMLTKRPSHAAKALTSLAERLGPETQPGEVLLEDSKPEKSKRRGKRRGDKS